MKRVAVLMVFAGVAALVYAANVRDAAVAGTVDEGGIHMVSITDIEHALVYKDPEFAHAVARLVADGTCRSGIIIDGAGIGSCMVANKVPGGRAGLCYDVSSARNSREHNHANVLTLGAGLIGTNLAMQIVDEWLATEWAGGRHERRVGMIDEIDRRYRT